MAYNKTDWQNLPNTTTPVNKNNLNKIEEGIYQNSIDIQNIIPAGIVSAYGGNNAPEGWLICDGSEVSRTTYRNLFSAIGINYGEGNGTTTFNLPNLKGKVVVGIDSQDEDFDTAGKTGGEKKHTLTKAELPSLVGSIVMHAAADATNVQSVTGDFQSSITNNKYRSGGDVATGARSFGNIDFRVGNNTPHNILQPYTVVNYIIKY